ncbi:lysophospholipid acyltransferase family protein [Frondihabitans australicus]|uniref:1-acyl-sn-glycerol-3-phosphate acyltransferase n=1 Tax=Frondihabitans australicus TaxID=386892 RepID=A0A495IFZ0_9MICO|nr:lysophospholipid acyltransferase family protein [Frondihabitans australicus]RKR74669.1 1-acyl-sn-glycerol-3-phosphate acyltransferase [Frondihabitans australicus]
MYWFLRLFVARPAAFGLFRIRVRGLSNIPKRGGIVLAGNHIAFIDSVFVPVVVPRPMTYLVGSNYMSQTSALGRLLGWFLRAIHQLPIDRSGGSASKASLDAGVEALARGAAIGIYPEGSRSRDGRLHRGRTGVARLLLATGAPVVPFAIQGSDRVTTKGLTRAKRADVTIVFGEPLTFAKADGDVDAGRMREVTDEIMRAIGALTPQEYDDSYTTSRG